MFTWWVCYDHLLFLLRRSDEALQLNERLRVFLWWRRTGLFFSLSNNRITLLKCEWEPTVLYFTAGRFLTRWRWAECRPCLRFKTFHVVIFRKCWKLQAGLSWRQRREPLGHLHHQWHQGTSFSCAARQRIIEKHRSFSQQHKIKCYDPQYRPLFTFDTELGKTKVVETDPSFIWGTKLPNFRPDEGTLCGRRSLVVSR